MKADPASSRSRGLDTLRALAILAVMFYHLTIFGELPMRLLPVTGYGWIGVDLFFVLSGFLIGRQVLRPWAAGGHLSVGDFYRRRAWRILPAYLTVVAVYFLVPGWRESPHLPPLWKFLTFTMNFGLTPGRRAFSAAWSLCVEEHFYLLLPLIALLLLRRPSTRKAWSAFAGLLVCGILLRAWLITRYPDDVFTKIYYPTDTRLDGLTMGVALAAIRTFRSAWWAALMHRGHLLFASGAACVAAVVWLFRGYGLGGSTGPARWGTIFGFPLLALGLALITASSVSRNGWLARIRVPGAQTLATLAFTLYLTHKAVAHLIMLRLPRLTSPQGPLSWLLYAVGCLLVAGLLHFAVERPCLRLRDRRTSRQTSTALEADMRRDPAL